MLIWNLRFVSFLLAIAAGYVGAYFLDHTVPENKLINKEKIFAYFTEQTSNFLINNYEKEKKLKYISLNNINFYKD